MKRETVKAQSTDLSGIVMPANAPPPSKVIFSGQTVCIIIGGSRKTMRVNFVENDTVYCRDVGNKNLLYHIPLWAIADGSAKWFRKREMAVARRKRREERLAKKLEQCQSQQNRQSVETVRARVTRMKEAKKKKTAQRQKELNGFAELTNILSESNDNSKVSYESNANNVIFVSNDGLVIGHAKDLDNSGNDLASSESWEVDTWKGLGVARPELNGRFGGIIGEDHAD